MNNQFNTTNITTQHGIQMAQHVPTSPPQTSAAVLNTFLNAQQQQQQQQLAAAVAAGAIYGDPRQLQLNANTVDYPTTPAALGAMGTHQSFYAANTPAASAVVANPTVTATAAHHPNTILITNNFSNQQAGPPLSPDHQRNISIVTSTSNPLSQANTSNLATTANGFQHAQHVFNLHDNKQLQHLFPHHLLSSFQPAPTELLQQHYATQGFPSSQQLPQQNHVSASALEMPHFYVPAENSITGALNSNQKIVTNISSNNATPMAGSATPGTLVGSGPNSNNSTVVLDRINICINNLYTDTSSSSTSNSLASTPAQQPSPIIPAIQHKPVVENGTSLPISDSYEANVLVIDEPDSTTTATTPHTPPSTPENKHTPNIANSNVISTTSLTNNSPSTSYIYQKLEKSKAAVTTKLSFSPAAQCIEDVSEDIFSNCSLNRSAATAIATTTALASASATATASTPTTTRHPTTVSQSNILASQPQATDTITTSTETCNTPLTPPTPPSPSLEMTNNNKECLTESDQQVPTVESATLFANGEDVFIKRHDNRFYLGTVIKTAHNQFLVRFDDKTEIWCEAGEMRKLTVSTSNKSTSTEEQSQSFSQPMCVACKRTRLDSTVEICERCGRGYHRKCTTETSPGSEIWVCKRCTKPMKFDESSRFSSGEEEMEPETCILQLHYDVESLTWDEKHRMNKEQIYCYCGKSGKFDNNMLQCWRCLNWYHAHCTQKSINNLLLRGDCFFVFCCSVCNEGDEYLRRIQASWVELVHLVLYNLSTLKKHHKYHHLFKDINPYILEKRKLLPAPREWIAMPDKEFLDKVKCTLNENNQLFVCGKEIKREFNNYALRTLEPPVIEKCSIKPQELFNDEFVFNNLKRALLQGAPENIDFKFFNSNSANIVSGAKVKRKLNEYSSSHDVYEFEDTSEDEIPIKHMLDKVKKTKLSPSVEAKRVVEPKATSGCLKKMSTVTTFEKMDVEDDNANDALLKEQNPKQEANSTISPSKSALDVVNKFGQDTLIVPKEKSDSVNAKKAEQSSRKRKAFTFSKSYSATHLIDSSSDENSSSSSRGTSLDLIIPPPKNFLGHNNPFRIISPRKNVHDVSASTSSNKKSVSFGIFNTTALNFSSKLAALKSAGLFPKLSTSNLAKAAGQPRTVRTIKRRLSAKDITIGPNKEVRRRRTRRLSSNIEVISTTTINPMPTNFFPIQAKDLLAAAAASTTNAASLFTTQARIAPSSAPSPSLNINNSTTSSASSSTNIDAANGHNTAGSPAATSAPPTHGRLLRQRPQKTSPNTSRRSSVSSNQSSTSSASAVGGTAAAAAVAAAPQTRNPPHQSQEDLKQTVNKYFGIVNRIESGEQFSIRAKRQLANGQMQYLIEWGEAQNVTTHNFSEQTADCRLAEVSTPT